MNGLDERIIEMKTLSFIIPSYNSAQFLDKCIGSFLDPQVIDRLDIIIVNDGSTDDTPAVAQKFCDRYPGSIRLINQENKGHGGALNTGCAAAVGKYLKVIDADDWVETANLEYYLELLEGCDSDVVLTHHYTRDISTGEVKKWMSYPARTGQSYTLAEIMADWKSFDRSLTFHGITYKTDFYHRKGIQLSEHVFYEDHEFATFPCCHAESVTPMDLFLYDYRIGDVQQSVSNANQLRRVGHTETVLKRMIAEYTALDLPEGSGGREYVAMKAQGLLLSYLTTVMLVQKDKKLGRRMGEEMMERFRRELPRATLLADSQYKIFRMLNRFHVSKDTFDRVLRSKLYNKLRHNHDFK